MEQAELIRIATEAANAAVAHEMAQLEAAERNAQQVGQALEADPTSAALEAAGAEATAEVLRRFGRWEGARAAATAIRLAIIGTEAAERT